MTNSTERFLLPFILAGQAQKELYHNEALATLDAALHPAVEEGPLATPPASPEPGQAWIVSPSAEGAWTGMGQRLARWGAGGWRFVAPVAGMAVWNKAAGHWIHFDGAVWMLDSQPAARLVIGGDQVVGPRRPPVPSPSGGTIIDVEARAAIDALIATLISHGLTE